MEQTVGQIIKAEHNTTLPTKNWSDKPQSLCSKSKEREQLVLERFGDKMKFLSKVNPDTQVSFGKNSKAAIMGDYPTLDDIDNAYGKDFASEWLLPHIANLAISVGAKNLTIQQERSLSRIIATEYRHFKITELLLFFYLFKTGRYGKFYGNVDPMVVTCALRDFAQERAMLLDKFEQEERELRQAEEKMNKPAVSWEEYKRMKQERGEQIVNLTNPLKKILK